VCNLYTLEKGPDAIRKIFEAAQIPLTFPEGIPNFQPRSVRITDRAPIVRFNRDSGSAELVERRWSWPAPGGKPVFNMRSDGREFGRDRCLVIADGFYEWEKRPGEPKQPWWVTRPDHEPFAFAGLWSSWRPAKDVEPLRTVAIVTTQASEQLAPIHDRMPVMLAREAEQTWLDHEVPAETLLDLCVPLRETAMLAVSDAVNDARHDEPDCLEPAKPPLTLF
jgi:putative SOS response-associated peptidase YedK